LLFGIWDLEFSPEAQSFLLRSIRPFFLAGGRAEPSILGQNKDGTLVGVVWEQKIACGPTGCLVNYWQDLDGDGDADIVTLYAVPTDGEKRFIMQEQSHSKRNRKEL
jgi:hypothetical protein